MSSYGAVRAFFVLIEQELPFTPSTSDLKRYIFTRLRIFCTESQSLDSVAVRKQNQLNYCKSGFKNSFDLPTAITSH